MLARTQREPEGSAMTAARVTASERGVRTFRDDGNREWEVRAIQEQLTERQARLLPRPELAQGWLLFTCGEERRRYETLPPGWSLATEALLRRWCDDASPVVPFTPRRRPSDEGMPSPRTISP